MNFSRAENPVKRILALLEALLVSRQGAKFAKKKLFEFTYPKNIFDSIPFNGAKPVLCALCALA